MGGLKTSGQGGGGGYGLQPSDGWPEGRPGWGLGGGSGGGLADGMEQPSWRGSGRCLGGGVDDVGTSMVTHDDVRPDRTMVSRRFGWVLWAMDPAAVLHGLGGDSSGRDRRHWDMRQLRLKATAAQLSSRHQKLNCGVLFSLM